MPRTSGKIHLRYCRPNYEEHPSRKPEALMERIIKASSNSGDVVLDPLGGTFTINAAADRLARCSISVDLQAEYVKGGLRRLSLMEDLPA